MKKTVLINQSGALGDIFCVAPIAKYYRKQGYIVFWPVREQFFNLVANYFPYVNALMIDKKRIDSYTWDTGDWLKDDSLYIHSIKQHYDVFLDLADRGDAPMEQGGETFEETKYRIASVPYENKHRLEFTVDYPKARRIERIFGSNTPEYVLAHLSSSHGDRAEVPKDETRSILEIVPYEDYEIPDWIFLIQGAKAFYCVESAVHQFVDGIINKVNNKELYLLSRASLKPGECYTKSEFWNKKYMK